MPDTLGTFLMDLRDFAFPFVVIGATVLILITVIRKFDFFRAGSKILGLHVEAGSHQKVSEAVNGRDVPQVVDRGVGDQKQIGGP